MCGIAGIINKENTIVFENDIQELCNLVLHRGPDGNGTYIYNQTALGHTRLSILDLSEQGSQPFHYHDKYSLTFNGEIYNYIELRDFLKTKGYTFNTSTDTEVILAAYDFWGINCLNHFNGMWSFALIDKLKQEVFVARDRFGIKPFYYVNDTKKFVFGSEIKQCLWHLKQPKVNSEILLQYIVTGYENYNEKTFFEDINELPGSHYGIYNLKDHTFVINKYYELLKNESLFKNKSEAEVILNFDEVFLNSINLRMRSDVKVGTCLSGGIDSSIIALYSSSVSKDDKYEGVHGDSYDKSNNEWYYAKMVADSLHIKCNKATVTSENYLESLDDVTKTQEEPFSSPSIILQYHVMKKARETGNIVMLDGQGGDETLLGYERYYPALLSKKNIPDFIKMLNYISNNSKLTLASCLQYYLYFKNAYLRKQVIKSRFSAIKSDFMNNFDWEIINNHSKGYEDIFDLQHNEIFSYQLPHLLRYEDRNSMRWGIETRLPFLDYKVVEMAINLPIEYKLNDGWTKYILRKLMQNKLPDEIVWRKNKIGFEAPKDIVTTNIEYFSTLVSNSSLINSIFSEPINIKLLNNKQLVWRLISIANWERLYKVTY